jgi:nicotinamide-nucleotide amidase
VADSCAALVEILAQRLLARGERLAFAESCTGGLLAKLATDLAGSSVWFERGLVTYSNDAKHELLGVPRSIFDTDGAVSEACVRAMATGLMGRTPADWGVAVTGIAGPGGGNPGRPVGTVWIAWIRRGQEPQPRRYHFDGDRAAIRAGRTARTAAGGRWRSMRCTDCSSRCGRMRPPVKHSGAPRLPCVRNTRNPVDAGCAPTVTT